MASFYGFDFIYDDTPSAKFGLKIISFDDGSLFNSIGSSDVEIISQRVLRKSIPYFLGRTQPTVLEFPLTFGSAYPLSGFDRDLISAWLFGRSTYKKLYILQDDLNGAYFNCFLTKPEPLYIGNLNYAFKCQVVCDSPWAYGVEHTVSGSVVGGEQSGVDDFSFTIYNGSSEDEYLYPKIHFELTHWQGPFSPGIVFRNLSDTGMNCSFNYLEEGYTVTVDNDLQIIEAFNKYEMPVLMLPKFSKKWFRLLPGVNECGIMLPNTGDIIDFYIKWTERMKIGG